METRQRALLSLVLTCGLAIGKQPDNLDSGSSAEAPYDGSALAGSTPYIDNACSSQCMSTCGSCEPWRLFSDCRDGEGINVYRSWAPALSATRQSQQ